MNTKIIYNDKSIRTAYVNASRLTADLGEIGLLFGVGEPMADLHDTASVRLTNRIILSPYAAKRLSLVLQEALRAHEDKYGPLDQEHQTHPSGINSPLLSSSLSSRPEITDERAGRLFEFVKGLNVRIGIERSFKFYKGSILSDRFLMGFKREDVTGDSNSKILAVCTSLGMPADHLDVFRKEINKANVILFGFEGEGETCLYKAYLEFGWHFKEVSPENLNPFIVHKGFKWDPEDNTRSAIADYTCFPMLSMDDVMKKVSAIYSPVPDKRQVEMTEALLKSSYERVGCDEVLYLEVSEEDNPRKSFDLNIYRANFKMKELLPVMKKICAHFSIPEEKFDALYEPVKTRVFGHLSGGVDRSGRDFMTVYFGVKGSSATSVRS